MTIQDELKTLTPQQREEAEQWMRQIVERRIKDGAAKEQAQEPFEPWYEEMTNLEAGRLSLEDDGEHVHCPKCGDLFIADDSDLCSHLALPLFRQTEVAEATGISQGNISDYERDKGNPTVATLQKLCDCYGTTISKLTKHLD